METKERCNCDLSGRKLRCFHCNGNGVFRSRRFGEVVCHVCHGERTVTVADAESLAQENGYAKAGGR